MSLLDRIRKDYPKAVERECRDEGKKLKKGRAGEIVILHGENLKPGSQPICDCIALRETSSQIIVAIVELKSKTIRPSRAIKQLKGCYQFVKKMLQSYRVKDEMVSYRFAIFAEQRSASDMKLIRRADIGGESVVTKKYTDTLGSLLA